MGAIGAAALVVAGAVVPSVAYAAPPAAGEYSGTSLLQYAGDNPVDWEDERSLSFHIDSEGTISELSGGYFWSCVAGGEPGTTAYFEDAPLPPTQIDVGEPFEIEWSSSGGGVDYTFEGTIEADGTATGAVMADLGVCGASILTWSAHTDDAPEPAPTFEIDPIDPVSVWDLARGGVTLSVTGLERGEAVTVEVGGQAHALEADFWGDLVFSFTGSLTAGTHTVTVSTDAGSVARDFLVVPDEEYFDPHTETALMLVTPEVVAELDSAAISVFARYLLAGTSFDVVLDGEVIDTVHTGDYDSIEYELTGSPAVGSHIIELVHPAVSVSRSFEVVPTGDGAPAPAGTYEGTATQEIAGTTWTAQTNEFPLTFTVDEHGVISALATEYRWVCWLSPDNPTGTVDLTGMPDARITADRAFGIEWVADNLDDISVSGTVHADGSAAGSIHIDTGSCGIAYLSWTATGDLAEDPDPVYDPSLMLSAVELTQSELADTGLTITGAGFPANAEATLRIAGEVVDAVLSNDAGEVEFHYTSDALGVGTHTLVVSAAGDGARVETTLTVIADEPGSDTIPAVIPTEEDLDPALAGAITVPAEARAGETIAATIDGAAAGDTVGVWLFSTPVYLGAHVVSTDGTVAVTVPEGTAPGEHRIGVWAGGDQSLIGWDVLAVVAPDDGEDPGDDNGAGGDDGSGGDDGAGGDSGTDNGAGGDDGAGGAGNDANEDNSDDQLAATGAALPLTPAAAGGALLLLLGAAAFWGRRRALRSPID